MGKARKAAWTHDLGMVPVLMGDVGSWHEAFGLLNVGIKLSLVNNR